MASLSRKLKREQGFKRGVLTEKEYLELEEKIREQMTVEVVNSTAEFIEWNRLSTAEFTVLQTLTIAIKILEEHFGKLQKKESRYKNFTELYADAVEKIKEKNERGCDFVGEAVEYLKAHDLEFELKYIGERSDKDANKGTIQSEENKRVPAVAIVGDELPVELDDTQEG